MRRSLLLWGTVFLVGAAVLLLIGAAAPSGSRPWEYALYLEYPGGYEWQTPGQRIRAANAQAFFEQMSLTTSIEGGALRTRLFNSVGQQGWELTQVVKDGGQEAYWFKRPK